ncbi:MAG: BamA/TamA family outer membrane protein [Nitrospirota bacterium]
MLCIIVPFSIPTLAQETSGARQQQGPSSAVQNGADIPVPGTEEDRAEADQAEAREEALKSLVGPTPYTVIPVPVIHYSLNESYWVGAALPILESNAKGELQHIYVPFFSYNRYVGATPGIYYYGYPSDTAQYSVTADYSEKSQRDIDLTYKDVGAGGGRYVLAGRVNWFKNPFRRLFGIGNQTSESDDSSYTSGETLVELTAGINVHENVRLMWTEHYHEISITSGIVNSLPQAQVQFSQLPGMEGATIVGHKLTARYDTRDKQLISTQGTYMNLSVEWNQNLQQSGANQWLRTTFDARHLLPHYDGKLVFVARFFVDTVNGHTQNIPFYELPTLGGETTLRGFGQSRFIDDTALLFNFEERIPAKQLKAFDYLIDLEVAPFLDIGRVMSGFSIRDVQDFQVNPGIGLRILARPHVVGRLDVAYGRDGENLFVGLDYPF